MHDQEHDRADLRVNVSDLMTAAAGIAARYPYSPAGRIQHRAPDATGYEDRAAGAVEHYTRHADAAAIQTALVLIADELRGIREALEPERAPTINIEELVRRVEESTENTLGDGFHDGVSAAIRVVRATVTRGEDVTADR